ncbi:putative 39s ribosomal protein l45 [Quercus suber]|uniref:Large ribosomal subunit protein mL45 n=1 Tax=Quercus suber TaxID=58331 RepID=A0AAW0J4G0_QUESU
MALRRLQTLRSLYRTAGIRECSYLLGSSRSYSTAISNVPELNQRSVSSCLYKAHNAFPLTRGIPELNQRSVSSCLYKAHNAFPLTPGSTMTLRSTMAAELLIFSNDTRSLSTQVKAPPQARQMGALKVSMTSPGFIYEPYAPREQIPFWRRWFTRSGWKRTKDDIILELKSAYAINKLRKSGYSKQKFYNEAVELYKEINTLMANGDKSLLRKAVTEKMYSALKNEIKQRESMWSKVYWEMITPIIGVDRNDLNKVFIQLTLEFLSKQKFEAYDSNGDVVAGDKSKEVLVRDIWVFEKSLFHPGAYWRLCGRISTKSS